MRLTLSLLVARIAAWASRTVLRRSGQALPGKVLLKLHPKAISELSAKRRVILVSGTNGKTSTTKVLTEIISQLGETVSNRTGSNLDRGSASALMEPSKFAVLEVDELYLPKMIEQSKPEIVLLLNLSRDQLHRMHEVRKVCDRWKAAVKNAPETTFIGDVDDPFIAAVLMCAAKRIRISFGGRRHLDGAVCPSCGLYLKWSQLNFKCSCGLSNSDYEMKLQSGSAAYRNCELANIVGSNAGAKRLEFSSSDLERTVEKQINGLATTIRLVKNPASWSEALTSLSSQNIVLILNAREVDGIDTSWLWDVSFENLRGRKIIVCGERAIDLVHRLHVAGIDSDTETDLNHAVKRFSGNAEIEVLAAYTAFFSLVTL